MEERYNKFLYILKDEKNAKEILSKNPEDAAKYLESNFNIVFEPEEMKDVFEGIKVAIKNEDDALSVDELDSVVGGAKKTASYYAGYYIGKTVKAIGNIGKAIASIFG